MTSTDFTVKILGDKSNAKKVVDQFGDDLGKASSKWGGALKNAASTAGGVLAALGIQDVTQKVMDFGQQSVDAFKEGGALNPESNVQFGEGGAGTFSDGKLTTNIKNPRCRDVLPLQK